MCPDGDYCEVAQDVLLFNEKHSDVSYAINKMNSCSKKSSPRKLDKLYKVGEILGKGGFGTVYAGVRRKDGRCVAIKHIAKAKIVAMDIVSVNTYINL